MMPPECVVSLWDMLELHAPSFLGAATEIARLRQIMVGIEESSQRHEALNLASVGAVKPRIEILFQEANKVGAKLACVSAQRLYGRVIEDPCAVTMGELSQALTDIESRFADHLSFVKLFVIPEDRAILFGGAETLLSAQAAPLYTSLWFDCEEAAKSLCLGRSTACVFHTMRMLEIAIAAISKRLAIPDPAKVDRSWGNMLKAIKGRIDELHPVKKRVSGCEGSRLEEIYVTLDAVKNPWRNGTMHVESVYTEEEARHILTCTSHLLDKMAAMFDENGADAPLPDLALAP